MYPIVLVLHVIVSLFLILVVLLQTGKGGDIASAFGGSGSQAVFGPRGAGNVLTKATTWSAGLFMVTSLALVFLSQPDSSSVLDETAPVTTEQPAAPVADAPIGDAPSPADAAAAASEAAGSDSGSGAAGADGGEGGTPAPDGTP